MKYARETLYVGQEVTLLDGREVVVLETNATDGQHLVQTEDCDCFCVDTAEIRGQIESAG